MYPSTYVGFTNEVQGLLGGSIRERTDLEGIEVDC